ncbi:ATPase family protein associated with various cellular activities (AAA) [Bradyrhizobium huanghuaihaiense]|uniref:ATPase family protein associated with various cellular activities (AAA) n=1 Tax=Bradyrhizobium huanghuaihaiense TaxID=990078 RepID=A0A562RPW4_9BRAD|nr:AAA family ATPase [Bradyrhizobium huanghuaihaiense]TWI70426.1 ATPase family protein associated with various cellular activities (AAA) [Bradyrhizobium huanghuaihaiense]
MTKLQHPALITLMAGRWDDAFGDLHHLSEETLGAECAQRLLDKCGDRRAIQSEIRETVDELYKRGTHQAGELALAWSMMTCRPSYPPSFRSVLPQLQYALDAADLSADDDGDCRERLRIWWAAGAGDYVREKRSPFALAAAVLAGEIEKESALVSLAHEVDVAKWFRSPHVGPTLTVMPASRATKLNSHNRPFAEILDKELPLVCARNLDQARRRLSNEFPHASAAIAALFRDLREGEPIKFRPTILVSQKPGTGKSRFVRRIATAIGLQHVHRYDGAVSDGQFSGTSKGWSNTEASVPARAVLASRTGNPLVFIDELDKCSGGRGSLNGSLTSALLPFLEVETAKSYRDQSLDCELDLSMASYICTANDVSLLPDYLRDRFRIVRVPAPRLVDLPLLASSVMEDLAREDPERAGDEPLAPDELMVIAKAWEKAGFSLRKLQAIIRATLEARDAHAMRH